MNFYKRFMGDYGKKTAHLSLMEHGAYTLLLDALYSMERGLPAGYHELFRICRAMSKVEQMAVAKVADEFLPVCEDGLRHNTRATEEMEDAAPLIEAARENGKKGGRPKKQNPEQTQRVSGNNPDQTQDESSPEPKPFSPSLRSGERATRLPKDWVLPDAWRVWACTERPDLNITKTAASFADHWHALAGAKARKLDWEATWRNWVRAEFVKRGAPEPEVKDWFENRSGVEGKARELGLRPWIEIEEQWPTFRQRVMQAVKDLDAPAITFDQLKQLAAEQRKGAQA